MLSRYLNMWEEACRGGIVMRLCLKMRGAALRLLGVLATISFVAACGTEIGNPKKPEPTPLEGSIFLTDGTAAAGLITSLFDDASASGTESADAAGSESTLALLAPKDDRKCELAADGTVTVTRDFSGEMSVEKKRKKKTYVTSVSGADLVSRVYSKPGVSLACNAAGNHVRLGLTGFFGLTVSTTFERTLHKSITEKETGKEIWARNFSSKGTNRWDVSRIEGLPATSFGLATTEQRTASRSLTISKKDGTVVDVSSDVGTIDGTPLVIKSEFDKGGSGLISRTISSGTVYSKQPNDSRIETSFSDVKYTPAGGCVPESGKIEGKIFAEGQSTAGRTYVVEFDEDGMTIKFDNGESIVTQPEHCPVE